MIKNRISYFENLDTSMDNFESERHLGCKKKTVTDGSDNEVPSRVKQMLCKFTEIKRPSNKSKIDQFSNGNLKGAAVTNKSQRNTLPRRSPKIQNGTDFEISRLKHRGRSLNNRKRNNANEAWSSTNSMHLKSVGQSQLPQKYLSVADNISDEVLTEKLDELKEKLIQKRLTRHTSRSESTETDNHDYTEAVEKEIEKDEPKNVAESYTKNIAKVTNNVNYDCKETVEKISKEKQEDVAELDFDNDKKISPVSDYNSFIENNNGTLDLKQLKSDKDNVDDTYFGADWALDTEDIFGLNDFDEECEDNYVIEAYNDFGKELVFTFFEVKRRSVHIDDTENRMQELLNGDSDIVFHEDHNDHIEIIQDNMIEKLEGSTSSETHSCADVEKAEPVEYDLISSGKEEEEVEGKPKVEKYSIASDESEEDMYKHNFYYNPHKLLEGIHKEDKYDEHLNVDGQEVGRSSALPKDPVKKDK